MPSLFSHIVYADKILGGDKEMAIRFWERMMEIKDNQEVLNKIKSFENFLLDD